jgi:hypothetical protein
LYDFDERSNNLGKKGDAHKHEDAANYFFVSRNWEVISISNGGEGGECIVAHDDNLCPYFDSTIGFEPFFIKAEGIWKITQAHEIQTLLGIVQLVHLEVLNESFSTFNIGWCVDIPCKQPPEASYEVCNHENNDNKPENLIYVHGYVETLESVSPSRVLIVSFNNSFEPAGVQDGN